MSRALDQYLDQVMIYANRRDEPEAASIRAELRDHLEAQVEKLRMEGRPPEDAVHEAIRMHGHPRIVGYGLRPRFPLIDVRSRGTACGVIAIGPRAVGVFAFGGAACGVVACGGFSLGIAGMGGFVASLLFAWGGFAFVPAGLAYAGFAAGLLAVGGFAGGLVATGGIAAGLLAEGGLTISVYTADTAPSWLLALRGLFPAEPIQVYVLSILLPLIFFPILVVSQVLAHREQKRVREADPWLVE